MVFFAQLIALDQQTGVRPVGVGETFIPLVAKWVLQVMGQEANTVCGTEQLTEGLEEVT